MLKEHNMPRVKLIRIALPLLMLVFLPAVLRGDDVWRLVRDADGITIFLRDTKTSNIKECKGIMTLENVTLSSLLALMDDTPASTKWVYNCIDAKVLKSVGKTERYVYLAHKFPFGLSDRDLITRSTVRQDPATKDVIITMTAEPDFIPPAAGLVRIRMMKGQWVFHPKGPGIVEVEYKFFMDPGGNIFSWMVNMGLTDAPFHTLSGMRKIVKLPKYQNAFFEEVKEP